MRFSKLVVPVLVGAILAAGLAAGFAASAGAQDSIAAAHAVK